MVDPQGRVSRWGSACLGAGVIFGWASHALKRCVAPEFCGRFSPRFPPRGLGTDDGSRRAALALTFPLLSRLRTSRRDCVRLRQIPQYDDFARLERDLRALAADAPGESSRRGPGRPAGAALARKFDKDGSATRERAPSLRVALVGRAAADEDDLVTCAHAVMEKRDVRETTHANPAHPDARLEAVESRPSWKTKPERGEPVRAIFVEATIEHHLARQTARHGEWLRDAQVVAAARVEAPRWRLEDVHGNRVVMHDARSFGELSEAARRNDWSLVVAHDRFDPAGGGATHADDGDGASVSGRILANLLDANLGLHVLGVRTRERVLAPGAKLTAVGEAVLEPAPRQRRKKTDDETSDPAPTELSARDQRGERDERGLRVRFREPTSSSSLRGSENEPDAIDAFSVTHKSFDEIVAAFGRAGSAFHAASVFCFVLGFGLTLNRVVRSRVVAAREKRFRQRLAAAEAARAENGEPAAEAPPGETCVVCLYSRATACYKECGHLVCCEACAARMQRCPLCRKRSAWMKVYRAGG